MTLINDLFELADGVAGTRSRLRAENLQKTFSNIRAVCNQAKRAWSGSSLGYHATVYFENITPKPVGVNFSSEWGIEDHWPVNSPHPGWREMDFQDVIVEIVARAALPRRARAAIWRPEFLLVGLRLAWLAGGYSCVGGIACSARLRAVAPARKLFCMVSDPGDTLANALNASINKA